MTSQILAGVAIGADVALGAGVAGNSCKKAGAVMSSGTKSLICVKSGKKLIWQATKTSVATTTTTVTSGSSVTLASLELQQTVGKVSAGPSGDTSGGPWTTRVVLATSTDGLTFTGAEIVNDQVGVPNLLVTSAGKLFLYYQNWGNGHFMSVAVRNDAGGWQRYKLSVSGFNTAGPPTGCDPSVVQLSDGRFRLYWMQPLSGDIKRVYSAVSDDGIRFVAETGYRFGRAGDADLFDPTVIKIATGWQMWTGSDGVASATSSDGLTFTEVAGGAKLAGKSVMPWTAAIGPGGVIRVIGDVIAPRAPGVLFESTDGGINFTQRSAGVLPIGAAGDVGLAYDTANARWVLAYLIKM